MPYVNIRVARRGLSEQQRVALSRLTTDVMVDILGKRRELVAVQVEESDAGGWFIGGRCLAEQNQASAYVEAKITLGTNSAAQKAEAVEALNRMLRDVLGEMAEASYVTLQEVSADAWGYAGLTQAARSRAKP